ncbi:hypothetical protein FA95DRAFT_1677213 [Auriscalpium vulgare]|uniref:Uncharacterized protein n=1 Tax=Auriscalpium vulgare TaxID=40419 RepID=A0ACB8S0J4_9AGAM|nr:hypothetical protein FA95DRAFT_1677213 [Auriscalpium vulgare]
MACAVSPASQSHHFHPHKHSNTPFLALRRQNKHQSHNPSAPRHHSSAAETTSTWRSHDRESRSHSRASSEDSTGSWNARSRSLVGVPVEHTGAVQDATASSRGIYSVGDLLALSASPLVGVDADTQAVLNDFVAHHVWRRGPGASSSSRRTRRGKGRHRSIPIQESTKEGDSEGSH